MVEVAGSSPAVRSVSEAEAVDAPGCGPGGSEFESRRTPHAALAQTGRGVRSRAGRFGVRVPGAARTTCRRTTWCQVGDGVPPPALTRGPAGSSPALAAKAQQKQGEASRQMAPAAVSKTVGPPGRGGSTPPLAARRTRARGTWWGPPTGTGSGLLTRPGAPSSVASSTLAPTAGPHHAGAPPVGEVGRFVKPLPSAERVRLSPPARRTTTRTERRTQRWLPRHRDEYQQEGPVCRSGPGTPCAASGWSAGTCSATGSPTAATWSGARAAATTSVASSP